MVGAGPSSALRVYPMTLRCRRESATVLLARAILDVRQSWGLADRLWVALHGLGAVSRFSGP